MATWREVATKAAVKLPTPPKLPQEPGATPNPPTVTQKDPFETLASLYAGAMTGGGGPPQYVVTPPSGGNGTGFSIAPAFVGIAAFAIVAWFGYRWWKRHKQ